MSEWISVEDRRPNQNDADIHGYVMSYRRKDRQWNWPTQYGFSKWDRVTKRTHTHWQPLPEPPKQSDAVQVSDTTISNKDQMPETKK